MEMVILVLIIGLAALYVGYTFYKQFTGKGGCAPGCSCDPKMQQFHQLNCHSPEQFEFKKKQGK